MDIEEFFDFESALTSELNTTLKRFDQQNPQMNEEEVLMLFMTSSCRVFVTFSLACGVPREKCYNLFNSLYNSVEETKGVLDV